jgi:hypothetical protein
VTFITPEEIERIALKDFASYKDKKGVVKVSFPLNPEDIFFMLFGLTTHYIDFDEHDIKLGDNIQLLGALYPEGFSFCGEDKLILVNAGCHHLEDSELFPFIEQMQRFTIFHEGGHYALHVRPTKIQMSFLSPTRQDSSNQPFICRSDHVAGKNYDPLEYQANRYAGAMMMPSMEVYNFVGRTNFVDIDKCGDRFRTYFGVSQKAMEKRLSDLGYRYINGKYDNIFKRRESNVYKN